MAKKIDFNEVKSSLALLSDFRNNVEPWCRQHNFSLHQAFEESRKNDIERYKILSALYNTHFGKKYLRSVFRGGKLRGDYNRF